MQDQEKVLATAKQMARTLADQRTDASEVKKVASYARLHSNGRAVFALLNTMVNSGAMVRSGQTIGYYRSVQKTCRDYLQEYQSATGEKGEELAAILAWTARLMPYYRSSEGSAEFNEQQREAFTTPPRQMPAPQPQAAAEHGRQTDAPDGNRWQPIPEPPPTPLPPVTKTEPVTMEGEIKKGKAQVKTGDGHTVTCTDIMSVMPLKSGDTFNAKVTRQGDKVIKAVYTR